MQMQKPKVAHVALSLDAGGLERLICNLSLSRELEGIESVVVCLDEPGVLAPGLEAGGVRVVVIKRRPGFDVRLIRSLAAFFRREGINAVHTHSIDPMFYGGLAAWLAGVRIRVHTQHSIMLPNYSLANKFKFYVAAKLFTKVVAVAEETRRGMTGFGIPVERVATILNGVDETRFPTAVDEKDPALRELARRDPEEWIFGTVARLAPEKGLHRMLQAFALVLQAHPNSRLIVVGDGPERAALQSEAERLGVSAKVQWLGYRDDVEKILPLFDLWLSSSLSEGIPLALLEAMAAGRAIAATRVGGVPEVVLEDCGTLVPADDSQALANAVQALMADPERRARMGANARRRVSACFSVFAMARAYRRHYLADPPDKWWSKLLKNGVVKRLPKRWILWRGSAQGKVALTFDDGPDAVYTPHILEILQQRGIQATFFLIGERAQRNQQLVERIVREGHEIANHSYSHPHFDRLSWKEALKEIAATQALLDKYQRQAGRFFRPPRGKLCLTSLVGALLNRLRIVMWSIDLKDFRAQSPEDITEALAHTTIRAGDVVLYHGNTAAAINALPKVIDSALASGQKLVPVSQLEVGST
jgi:glycosyltransferase involved in cell wall biosynthesis/peptidoglycan/xylan/chitin deacetylase (PgdA/CDA1 family)